MLFNKAAKTASGCYGLGFDLVMRKTDERPVRCERREDRLYHEGLDWYYLTRGAPRGPFTSRREALADLQRFVDTMIYLDEHPETLPDEVDQEDITHIDLKPPKY